MAIPVEMIAQSLIGLAQSNAPKIAQITGKSPEQIKSALEQGKKILPNIFQNGTTPQGASKILSGMGMDKSFIQQQLGKYSKYMNKVPGLTPDVAKPMIDALTDAMPDKPQTSQTQSDSKSPKFDSKKYPRI